MARSILALALATAEAPQGGSTAGWLTLGALAVVGFFVLLEIRDRRD
jgi:hypothetical protein